MTLKHAFALSLFAALALAPGLAQADPEPSTEQLVEELVNDVVEFNEPPSSSESAQESDRNESDKPDPPTEGTWADPDLNGQDSAPDNACYGARC